MSNNAALLQNIKSSWWIVHSKQTVSKLTVRIYFLVMNNRWISEEQGDNELTCSPLGPSLSLASAILYKKKKTKFFHLKSSYGNSAVKNDQEVWKHERNIRVALLCMLCTQTELCYNSLGSF